MSLGTSDTLVRRLPKRSDNKFDNDNAIGLYVLAQPENLSGSRHIDNMRLVYSSDGFTPEEEIYYPKGEGKCDFISYYPYQEEGIIQGSSNINVNVSYPARADPSNSGAVCLPWVSTGGGPEIRRGRGRGKHRPVVVAVGVRPSPDRGGHAVFQTAAQGDPVAGLSHAPDREIDRKRDCRRGSAVSFHAENYGSSRCFLRLRRKAMPPMESVAISGHRRGA